MIKMSINKRSEANLKRVLDRKAKDLSSRKVKQRAGKRGLRPVEKIAKSLVAVDTGALRDDIRIVETDDGSALIATKKYATSSEYLDRPYFRPAAQQGRGSAFKEAGKEFKKEAEKKT